MGDRSSMSSLKVLVICLLLLCSLVTGKPSPKHFLVQVRDNDEKNNDYGKFAEIHEIRGVFPANNDYFGETLNVSDFLGKSGAMNMGSINQLFHGRIFVKLVFVFLLP